MPLYSFECALDHQRREFQIQQQLGEDKFSPLFSDEWTGSCVWDCAWHLAEFLVSNPKYFQSCSVVVELGSGTGLTSLVACGMCNVKKVIATDQATMLELIQSNAKANLSAAELDRFRVCELVWGVAGGGGGECCTEPVDLVLISDCLNPVYGKSSFEDLAITISKIFDAGGEGRRGCTTALLAYECRCRMDDNDNNDNNDNNSSDWVLNEFKMHLFKQHAEFKLQQVSKPTEKITIYEITIMYIN